MRPSPDNAHLHRLLTVITECLALTPHIHVVNSCRCSDAGALRLASLLPRMATGGERKAAAAAVQAWLKSLPLARRPLVKSSVQLMTEAGIAQLQLALATPATVSLAHWRLGIKPWAGS